MIELAEVCRIGPAYLKDGKRDGKKLAAAVELFRSSNPPTVEEIVEHVQAIDGCAEGWMRWSDDKQWTPAWYFTGNDDGSWVVGLAAGPDSHEHGFDDRELACAHFIVKDIEDYGRILDARKNAG